MGIKERREKEKEHLRRLILKTATDQLAQQGYAKTTIRSIANEIEYSPRTIYLYFKDKDALLYEISVRAFTLFKKEFESVLSVADPFARLEKLNEVYIDFALDNPAYYDLMFILNEPMQTDETQEGWEIGMSAHRILQQIVGECMEAGYFKGLDAQVVAFSVWSAVHGMVSLKLRDRMKMYPEETREALISKSKDVLHQMLGRMKG